MEFKMPGNIRVTTTKNARTPEFLNALTYLTTTFPVSMNCLEVSFHKKDGVNFNANADYDAVKWPGFFNPIIRVAYGQSGKDPRALHYLFHEYKHLLQDEAGYLHDPKTQHINHCIEADAWAEEQLPIYLKTLEAL